MVSDKKSDHNENNNEKVDINHKDNEYNLEELAKLLKTSKYTLRRRIADGRLKASKIFGEYKVTQKELEDFLVREEIGRNLKYFNKKGFLYKKECEDVKDLEKEAIYLVEEIKILAKTDAAKIYYERGLHVRKGE